MSDSDYSSSDNEGSDPTDYESSPEEDYDILARGYCKGCHQKFEDDTYTQRRCFYCRRKICISCRGKEDNIFDAILRCFSCCNKKLPKPPIKHF
jgi:hypothetical protein